MVTAEVCTNFAIPILFVAIGVLANRLGRKDGDPSPIANDFAVGTTVFIMSLGSILSKMTYDSENGFQADFIWIVIFLVLIFASIDIDRYSSWKRDEKGMPTEEKHTLKGIVIPNCMCVAAYAAYRFIG